MNDITTEDLLLRSRFVQDLAANARTYAVEGPDGYAHVASPRRAGETVLLLWSSREDAARWADVLVTRPKVVMLPLAEVLERLLPALVAERRSIGVNWSDRPSEPELTADELAKQLRQQLVADFIDAANDAGGVWVLKHTETPVTFAARDGGSGETMPAFADRASAERAAAREWPHTQPVRVLMSDFLNKAVIWCVETRRRIAPAYLPGPGCLELNAWEVKAMLAGHVPVRRVA